MKYMLLQVSFLLPLVFPLSVNANYCINATSVQLLAKSKPYDRLIHTAAKKYSVDVNLIRSVMAIESCYNNKAVSSAGAQGLMQLTPDTADRFGVSNSFNAAQNINAGTRYLRFLQRRYKGELNKVLAAYNAGEGKVDHYKGVPPYKETQHYVKNVNLTYKKLIYSIHANKEWGKPGRQGIAALRARAPHLFKKK